MDIIMDFHIMDVNHTTTDASLDTRALYPNAHFLHVLFI